MRCFNMLNRLFRLHVLLVSGFLILSTSPIKAWWDSGHMITAMIAYEQLAPEVKAKVDSALMPLQAEYPWVNNMVAAATWADEIKGLGIHQYNSWHYTNIPYNPDGVETGPVPEIDVVWAIDECKEIIRSKTSEPLEKARSLALLIHFVGDIHQPLHSTSMHTQEMPEGDRGGNNFAVASPRYPKLHMLWDDGCGYTSPFNSIYPYKQDKHALTEEDMLTLSKVARELTALNPAANIPFVKNLKPGFWAMQSHHLAIEFGYHGVNAIVDGKKEYLEPFGKPTELYLKNGQQIVRKQLALGGYRLAMMLNELFGTHEQSH